MVYLARGKLMSLIFTELLIELYYTQQNGIYNLNISSYYNKWMYLLLIYIANTYYQQVKKPYSCL